MLIEKAFRRYWIEPKQRAGEEKLSESFSAQIEQHTKDSLEARKLALLWLIRAQINDSHEGMGFDRAYNLRTQSWDLPYPETTGYIIPSFLSQDEVFPALGLRTKAIEAGEWLKSTQFKSGAICSKQWFKGNDVPSVFNTGMVLHGYTSLCEHGEESSFLTNAIQAADWITAQQDADGAWRINSFNNRPHSYYTMVAWALIRFGMWSNSFKYVEAGKRNLEWTISNQNVIGWIDHLGFNSSQFATTHTIAYSAQGLAESGLILGNEDYIESAENLIRPLNNQFKKDGFLSGEFNQEWIPRGMIYKNGLNLQRDRGPWECMTGTAQTSCTNWALHSATKKAEYLSAAKSLNSHINKHQILSKDLNLNGGISGSWPLHGPYDTLCLPNHAAKFFIDALSKE